MTTSAVITELERLHQLTSGADDSVFTQSEKDWIASVYSAEFNERIRECSCTNRYSDAVALLLIRLKKTGKMNAEKKYELKNGAVIWVGTNPYSHHNITDEIAAEYLAKHPDAVSLFSKVAPDFSVVKKATPKKKVSTK